MKFLKIITIISLFSAVQLSILNVYAEKSNDDIYDEAVDYFSNNENYTYNYSLGLKASLTKTGEISEFGNYDHDKLTEIFEYAHKNSASAFGVTKGTKGFIEVPFMSESLGIHLYKVSLDDSLTTIESTFYI